MEEYRKFLKAHDWENTPNIETDQQKQVIPPPFQKPIPENANLTDLIPPPFTVGKISLQEAIKKRKSHRSFSQTALTIEELSFLLWATQGVHEIDIDIRHGEVSTTKRTVPSGGSRHPFESYLVINRVNGLQPGIYRYLALEHKLCSLAPTTVDLKKEINEICYGQDFVGDAAVVFIWAVVPYRSEWRYSMLAHKCIAIEAGHICQNLYLACEGIGGAGTCAIGAYHQKKLDSLLGLDGKEEFAIYIAPVGKIGE